MAKTQPTHREVLDATAAAEATMKPQRVPVNVYETSAALVVLAPLPAVKAGDVTIELHGSTLRLWAHVRSAGPRDFVINEWEYGGYEREIDLPPGFGSGVEASLANGQLAVRVLRGDPTGELSVQPKTISA
jgi:HSP20 family molecular chaperone IbpA